MPSESEVYAVSMDIGRQAERRFIQGISTSGDAVRKVSQVPLPECKNYNNGHKQGRSLTGVGAVLRYDDPEKMG